jgi:FkbM family methyltransferase
MTALLSAYRRMRVAARQLTGVEPRVRTELRLAQEFHGNSYCGWSIPAGQLDAGSVVVDVGLGEDVSFSTSLIQRYGCIVHGFDPTPRAIAYIRQLGCAKLVLHEVGVAERSGSATFYLPNDERHVSGSLTASSHTGQRQMQVPLVALGEVFGRIGADHIDLLKLDIEGAEYDLLFDDAFAAHAQRIDMLCVEFHHRWPEFGRQATERAVQRLRSLGFRCTWSQRTSNEEFTFVRDFGGSAEMTRPYHP